MSSNEAVIVEGARIPVGRFLGSLLPLTAPKLGAVAIREAIRRANVDPSIIDEVIMGNVVQAGIGQAPARQAAIAAGVPSSASAVTINKICGSGLQAVMFAAQAIRAGDGNAYVAGGMESMSNAPYVLKQARMGLRMGNSEVIDAVVHDGLWCAFENQHMGVSAEFIADKFGITREEQDAFALDSHRKAISAIQEGRFKAEIVPVEIPQKKGSLVLDTDEPPRADTTLEALSKLAPAFKPGGTVTAGNAPGLSDGAAALVVMERSAAREAGAQPLARITGYASAGIEPRLIFAAPVLAVRKLMNLTGLSVDDFDLIEVNEAFSAQILSNGKELEWDWAKVNVNGGGVALGHPIGASGARILVTLLYALRARGLRRGLAALCLGGGGAVALSVEMM
ncbi:MAG: acetyl-CoA C-acetyltransferase [Chloroflexi bacterium]|nr:acetyl-CoA C-acetyltransferase [Chloroflexota bacterium]